MTMRALEQIGWFALGFVAGIGVTVFVIVVTVTGG